MNNIPIRLSVIRWIQWLVSALCTRTIRQNGFTRHQIMDGLCNIGCMVADPLDIFGTEQKMRTKADIAGIFHHLGQQFTEQ